MTPRIVSLFLFLTVCCSCHRIKHKLSQAKDAAIDKVFPPQDNKTLFAERFKTISDTEVTQLNIHTDYFGADFKEMYNFRCAPGIIEKIVKEKNMERTPAPDEGLGFSTDFTWWDKETMSKIRPYKVGKEYEYWEYLWYDTTTQQAWYLIFSL